MSSKLRERYDSLYTKIETRMLAWGAVRENRGYAAGVTPLPTLDDDYRTAVRPYWRQFDVPTPKKYSFRLFSNADKGLDEHADPRYIPDDLWFDRIIPHYNDLIFAKALQDKCLHNLLFPGLRRPETVVKNVAGVFYDDGLSLLTREEAADRLLHTEGRVLVKPSVGSGQGHNIRFYDADALTEADAEEIFRLYGKNFIIQKKLDQHEALARLNPDSLNTVRVITFLHRDKVYTLSSILRVGGFGSEVDNTSQGGFQGSILPGGRLAPKGFTHRNDRWEYIDAYPNGIRFADVTVPFYDRVEEAAHKNALRMGHFRILGWDFAVSPDGTPVLIEYNVIPGQNQESDGPTFGELTDEVLGEVFGKRS